MTQTFSIFVIEIYLEVILFLEGCVSLPFLSSKADKGQKAKVSVKACGGTHLIRWSK